MSYRPWSIFLLFAVLVGCIPVESVRVPDSLKTTSTGKSGIAFGSIAAGPKAPFTSQSILFRAKSADEGGVFRFVHDGLTNVSLDIDKGGIRGTVFFVRLPVGEYELYNFSFFINRAQFGSSTFSSKQSFLIPFSIHESRATYLGEFVAHGEFGRNFFGMSVPAGGYFVVANQFGRDHALLKKKEGIGEMADTSIQVVNPAIVNLPFFRDKP